LSVPFHQDLAILSDALGEEFLAHGESFILSSDQALQLEALATRLLRGEIVDTSVAQIRRLLVEISTLRRVSFSDVLRGFDGLVKQAAASLEKQVAPIVVSEGVDVWIDPLTYRPFLRSLVHVFRNAVAHGIETPEARWEAGKDETGKITCSVALERNAIKLSIADDGGGIDLDALRQRIVSAGIYSESDVLAVSDEELARLIFMDNISTQREVSELAGRGVGLAALLSETINFGGEVVVKTVAGQGTEFLFRLPLQQGDLSGALNHG
jgi:two-component system chemotaxis sensor kinase CheA